MAPKDKSYFIEAKVPREKREEWPVVCDARGNVIWLPLLKRSAFAISKRQQRRINI